MATALDGYFRGQLLERRRRINDALAGSIESGRLSHLLTEVDQALARLNEGSFGLCETCHDPVEADRLLADPLLRFCLDHLSDAEARALEADLETAARIQRGLLPEPVVRTAGWEIRWLFEPAGAVSGDYVDVIAPPGGEEILMVLADVSGKGVSAGFLMAHLRAIFRGLAGTGLAAEEILVRANRMFRESTLAPYFATAVCARANASGDLEVANGGHWPPLVKRRDGFEPLSPTGLPLGVASSCCYTSHRVCLDVGDTLIVFTDGLTEALDRDEEPYGEERLHDVIRRHGGSPLDELLAACMADLASFTGGRPRGDDLTLLVARRVD